MKIIDLLNMIANGKIPKKIKVDNIYTYIHDGIDYKNRDGTYLFDSHIETTPEDMNIKVEIIEEDKQENEIQLIEYNLEDDTLKTFIKGKYVFVDIPEKYRDIIDFYKNKINELTDEINKLKENKNE